MSTKKLQILNSVLKQAENADTLDGKHASEFALASNFKTLQAQVNDIQKNAYDDTEIRDLVSANASDIDALEELVGDTKVSDQIANAIVNKVDKVDGQRLITTDEADKLKALVIGENGQVGISGTVNADNVQGLADKLALKVDKVDGKGLSTNDYTTAEKNKLAAIETGANKTVVDSALNETSTNPVQNKVVNAAISDLNTLVGNTKVSDQISDALNTHRADMNAAMDEPGHIVHRTHYSKYVATLIDNEIITNDLLSVGRGEFCYNDIKDYDELTVIFDGVVYECPITVRRSDESYFYAGNFQDSAPEYPFYILGYLANESVMIVPVEGEHIVSVKLSEVAKKLDKKYLPDDVVAASDWNASEGEAGHILNRTHYKETKIIDIVPSGSFELDENAYCMPTVNSTLVDGKTYVITIDGVKYERVAKYSETFETSYIGSLYVWEHGTKENENDDAFCFMVFDDGTADVSLLIADYASKIITFSVQEFTEVIHKLPMEYLDMPDMSAAEGKPGHVLNRTHYSEPEVILADNVEITTSGISGISWISYNAIKDYEEITVVYDGITYVCPITFGIDTTDYDSKYFYFGNWNNGAPEYPFIFMGYENWEYASVIVPEGSHTLSVMAGEYVKKLDKKYLPDDIDSGVSSWNDLTDKPFHIETEMIDVTFDGNLTGREYYEIPGTGYTVKISPEYVPVSDMIGATLTYNVSGTEYTMELTAENAVDAVNVLGVPGTVILGGSDMWAISLPEETTAMGLTLSAGTWFGCIPGQFHVVSLSCMPPIEGKSVEKINPSCLPDGLPYSETVVVDPTFDGDMTGRETVQIAENVYLVKVTTQYVSASEVIGETMVVDYLGTETTITLTAETVLDGEATLGLPGTIITVEGNEAAFSVPTDTTLEGITITSGTWFMCAGDTLIVKSLSCLMSGEQEIVHKLDNKFIDADWMAADKEKLTNIFIGTANHDEWIDLGITRFWEAGGFPKNGILRVEIDGVPYDTSYILYDIREANNTSEFYFLSGNMSLHYEQLSPSREPFCIYSILSQQPSDKIYFADEGSHNVSISLLEQMPDKLPMKYLPDDYHKSADVEWMATGEVTIKKSVIMPEIEYKINSYISGEPSISTYVYTPSFELNEKNYLVEYDGIPYELSYRSYEGSLSGPWGSTLERISYLGNANYLNKDIFENTGEPFCFWTSSNLVNMLTGELGQHTIAVYEVTKESNKLPVKYLPDGLPYTTNNLEFDGNITGKEFIQLGENVGVVKVSTSYVPIEAMIDGTMTLNYGGTEMSIPLTRENVLDGIATLGLPGTIVSMDGQYAVFSVSKDTTLEGITITTGTWFMYAEGELLVKSLSCEVVHKLDNKYINAEWMATTDKQAREALIPEIELEFAENNHVAIIEGETAERIYSQLVSGATYIVSIDGTEFVGTMIYDVAEASWGIVIEQIGMVVFFDTQNISIYANGTTGTHTFAFYKVNEEPDKLPVKYLPDGVPYEKVINIDTTFDGNYLDKEFIWDNESQKTYLVKISPEVLTKEEVIGSTFVWHFNGSDIEYTVKESNIINANSYGTKPPVFILDKDGNSTDIYFVEYDCFYYDKNLTAGIWFRGCDSETSSFYAKSLSCMSSQLDESRKLSPNLLPESVATKEYINIRVPAWTDADEGKFLRIVNGTPTWVSIPDAKVGEY